MIAILKYISLTFFDQTFLEKVCCNSKIYLATCFAIIFHKVTYLRDS